MLKTLHARISAVLLALLCLAGASFLPLYLWTTRIYNAEVNQNLNRALATHLATDLVQQDLLPANFASDTSKRQQAGAEISHLMVLNPDIDIYCLDEFGNVLSYSPEPGQVQRRHVSLTPLRQFLAGLGPLPIVGDDPRSVNGQKVFSVAHIPVGSGTHQNLKGYIYIVLAGEQHDSIAGMLNRSYILRLGAESLIGGLLVVFAGGTLLAFGLTRRLRRLTHDMEAFQAETVEESAAHSASAGTSQTAHSQAAHRAQVLDRPVLDKPLKEGDEIARLESMFAEMAARIRSQIQKLEQADTYRREAVSNVSHDLRTPLAALQGYLETLLMKEATLSSEQRHAYLATATRHAQRLGTLVAELFDLAKLEAGESELHLETFAFAEFMQDVVMQFQLRAQQKGIRLEMRFEDGLPFVRGDIAMIERALENLLDNALRHTPSDGVVTTTLLPVTGHRFITVEVADSGPGIAPEVLPHIFERHYRAQTSAHQEQGTAGAGLGLAITKRIVELHGGTIEAQSTPPHGTTFSFTLPIVADL